MGSCPSKNDRSIPNSKHECDKCLPKLQLKPVLQSALTYNDAEIFVNIILSYLSLSEYPLTNISDAACAIYVHQNIIANLNNHKPICHEWYNEIWNWDQKRDRELKVAIMGKYGSGGNSLAIRMVADEYFEYGYDTHIADTFRMTHNFENSSGQDFTIQFDITFT